MSTVLRQPALSESVPDVEQFFELLVKNIICGYTGFLVRVDARYR